MSLEHNSGKFEIVLNKMAEIVPLADRLVKRFRVIEYLNVSFYAGLAGGAWATYFMQKGEYLSAAPGIIIPLVSIA